MDSINTKPLDITAQYLHEISQFPLLKESEIVDLTYRIKKGDNEAYEKLINHNLKLVVSIAKKFISSENTLLDLIQFGNEGLIHSVKHFDPTKGIAFSSYAIKCIEGMIKHGIRKSGYVKMHPQIYTLYQKFLLVKNGIEFINEEDFLIKVTEKMGISMEMARTLNAIPNSFISLNIPVTSSHSNQSELELQDLIPTCEDSIEYQVTQKISYEEIRTLLDECKISSKNIRRIEMYYGLNGQVPKTSIEIAKIENTSTQTVLKSIQNSLKKISSNLKLKKFAIYMDNIENAERFVEKNYCIRKE